MDRKISHIMSGGLRKEAKSQKFVESLMKIPATLPRESVIAIIDTREQTPLHLPGLTTEPGTLTTGDYSLKGMEGEVAIERKSLADLVGCCGRDRERFEREVQRLLAYRVRALVVEATWSDIELGIWRSQLTPKQVASSLVNWQVRGLPVITAESHHRAGQLVAAMLRRVAIHRWREVREFAKHITI